MATETPVRFTRGTTNEINRVKIVDGQLLYDTQTGKMYQDVGSRRISIGGGTALTLKKLTFTGASHAVYDGSAPVSVNIPQSGGGGGQGLSEEEKNLIITIMRSSTYVDDQSKNIDALEQSFNGGVIPPVTQKWNVVSQLEHCSNSNYAQSVEDGKPYSATISANEGYTLQGATANVTMGGVDVTKQVYNVGKIDIPAVTGNVNISISAVVEGEPPTPQPGGNGWQSGTPYELTYPDTGTIDESNGTVVGGRNNSVTDFLPCQGVEMIKFDFGQSSDVYSLAWYDENKKFITTQQSSAIQTEFGPYLPVENKAAYLRVEKREGRWISEITPFVFPAATSGKYVKGQIYKTETIPGYLSTSNGSVVSDERYDCTKEYIFVYGASTMTLTRYERKTVCWYDSQKNLVDSYAGTIGRDYPIPAEATYVRISANRGYVDYIRID